VNNAQAAVKLPTFSSQTADAPRHEFSSALALCALLCFCVLPGGQGQQAPGPQTTIRKQVDLVLVDVIVTDPKGTIVSGLRAKDFEIQDEGAPQEVVHLSQDEIPLAIALVVDVSGSMGPIMKLMKDALVHALPALRAEDRVALFSFADRSFLELGLTSDFSKVAKRIRGLGDGELTNVNDAVYNAADYLRKRDPSGRRVIILMSDGRGNTGSASAEEVERQLVGSEVALFAIGVPVTVPPELRYPRSVIVDRLAEESGGFMVIVHRLDGFRTAFESLIQILKSRYTLGFYPNTAGKPGSVRHLTVRLKNRGVEEALPNVMLRYRKQYVVPRDKTQKSR